MLLETEEEELIEELRRKQERQECGYCKEKKDRIKAVLDDLEAEKLRECLKALEKQKIAKGMMCTKEDEKRLKEMQKLQMMEKQNIERQEQDIDMMWHQLLVEEVRQKEHKERVDEDRRQRNMAERRRAYDEQITNSNRKRQEAIREEREKENRRLERMKQKMEKDHYETIKKKKEQQMKNRSNYIEGHEMKMSRLREEKRKAREIDNGTIRVALEELERERDRDRIQMRNLQIEKQIFVENFNRERQTALQLEDSAERIAREWKRTEENKTDEQLMRLEEEKRKSKRQAAQEYIKHKEKRLLEIEREKEIRREKMEQVKRTAYNELQKRLDSAKGELRRQIEYRNSLTVQLRDNQRFMEAESAKTEFKDFPFTKSKIMFKESLEETLKQKNEKTRNSTNPVHPFRRCLSMKAEELGLGTKFPHI